MVDNLNGKIPPHQFECFFDRLHGELSKFHFSKTSETNFIRLFTSLFDKSTFANDALKFPHHLELISAIVSNSNFLTDIVVQNPGFLYQVFDNQYLSAEMTPESIKKEIESGINSFRTFHSKLNFLKLMKKRFILKIGLNDILGFTTLETAVQQLSYLASSLLASLFNLCRKEIEIKYDTVIPEKEYCLASLGKLGGNELNYSSDTDLILFYEKDYSPCGTCNKEFFELLNETTLLFIKSSSEMTEKGYLYRVDFRLRPDGKNSPLCRTLTDYMRYYEARGENWERQMLIKLNFVCGGQSLYNSFYNYLRGFIFPVSHYKPVKEQVWRIKKEIERKIAGAFDIKLFPGGIRDIEFSVQTLQLLNGGKIKELRNGNTLDAIDLLAQNGLLTGREKDVLKKAYIFYRKTEHFLQLMNDRQTHLIPENEELLNKLSRYLNLGSVKIFNAELSLYRRKVRNIFSKALKTGRGERDYFSEINFADRARAEKNFNFLRNGKGLINDKEFEAATIDNFAAAEERIFKYLIKSQFPDKTLEHFTRTIKSSRFPSLWYNQFRNKYFLKAFLTVCNYSQISIDIIVSDKQAEDRFLSGECFFLPAEGEIASFNFKDFLLSLSALYALKKINEKRFSALAADKIDEKIKFLSKGMTARFFIAALGSYGAREMNFASDVDFLIIFENDTDIFKAENEYEKFISILGGQISPLEIDLRLRPEGKSSQLVRTLDSFEAYLAERARIWELQSFSKLRFVCGSKKTFNSFKHALVNKIKTIDKYSLKKEILGMHQTLTKPNAFDDKSVIELKKSKGGFATIEFTLQYLLMQNHKLYHKCLGRQIPFIIKELAAVSGHPEEMKSLAVNYSFIKKLLLHTQNISGAKNYKCNCSFGENKTGLINSCDEINIILKENYLIFNKILES